MEERRDKRNIVYFIISYVINNLASGVLYDTFVNYLQEAQTSIATSFRAFYGYATFISAALLLLVPKIGYKKLLLFVRFQRHVPFLAPSVWILLGLYISQPYWH